MITIIFSPLVEQEICDGKNALAHKEDHPRMMTHRIVLPVGNPLSLLVVVVPPNRSERRVTGKQVCE